MVTFEDLDCGSRYTTDDRKACELFGDPPMGSEKIEDLVQFRYPGVEAPCKKKLYSDGTQMLAHKRATFKTLAELSSRLDVHKYSIYELRWEVNEGAMAQLRW